MKQQNRQSFICRLAVMLVFLMAISIDCNAAIKAGDEEVNVNSTTTISLAATYQTTLKRSTNVTYRWSTTSTNLSITSQSAYSCNVKGLSAGTAQVDYHCSYYIDGYYRTMDFYYTVTVKGDPEPLTITPTSISLTYIGQTYTVKATQNGTVGGVYFVSNNENVAEVSVDYNSGYSTYGTVTAIGSGTTYVYAKNMKGDTSPLCTVTVTIPKQNQSLSLSSLPTMTYGDTWRQLPTSTDQGLSLTWSSSNSSVASVSSGRLYVNGAGQATITASNSGNSSYYVFSRSYTLNVSKGLLTVTANDCTKQQGEENPELTVSYSGFVKGDDASVLTTLPTVTTTATKDSPAGTYPITVSGAAAANYDMTYVSGTLTVTAKEPDVIEVTDISQMDNVIYIEPTVAIANETIPLKVKLKNNMVPVGCSFMLTLPEGFALAEDEDGDVIYELGSRAKKMSVTMKDWNNGSYDFALTPTTESAIISGDDDVVINFQVHVPGDMIVGDYWMNLTKCLIQSKVNGTTTDTELNDVLTKLTVVDYTMGDVNGDKQVTPTDAIMILYHFFKVEQNGFLEKAADINGDGKISPADAIEALYRYFNEGTSSAQKWNNQDLDPQ